jgi:hypothetical protein
MVSRDGFARFVLRRNLAALVLTLPLLVAGLAERVAEPLETFVETVTRSGASGLDVLFEEVSNANIDNLSGTSCVNWWSKNVPRRAASGSAGQACR